VRSAPWQNGGLGPVAVRHAVTALALTALPLSIAAMAPGPPQRAPAPSAVQEEQAWRTKHEADYRRDWVSIAGLFSLKPGANTAGSAKTNAIQLPASLPASFGTFTLTDTRVRFEPSPGVAVTLKGQPVTGPIDLRDDETAGGDELVSGDVRLAVHVSGEHRSIRVRDPQGPLATGFKGFTWFPLDAAYRVTGRFIRDPEPKALKVLNTFGDIDRYNTEGVVAFTLRGSSLRLRPFTTRPKRFYFVFRDASSGHETYEAARFLYSDLADDGTTVLDFNEAYNPPCSFNPYTTCPIPVPENRLKVKILAGEKAYPVHVPIRGGGGGR
jgi:hypothetical protein